MVVVFNPRPEPCIEAIQRKRLLAVEVGEELLADGTEPSFHLSAPLRLVGWCVNDQDAERCRNAGEKPASIDLAIVDVQAAGQTPC